MKRELLEQRIRDAQGSLDDARRDLAYFESNCQHDWKVEADNIYHKAYTIPGDPPGTMGVDRQPPCHVPAQTDYRWKRTCKECGKVEHTTRTKEKVTRTPQF